MTNQDFRRKTPKEYINESFDKLINQMKEDLETIKAEKGYKFSPEFIKGYESAISDAELIRFTIKYHG